MLLPIMLTILAAKLVGDRFTKSLYEIHIYVSGMSLLEADQLPEALHLTPARQVGAWPCTHAQSTCTYAHAHTHTHMPARWPWR